MNYERLIAWANNIHKKDKKYGLFCAELGIPGMSVMSRTMGYYMPNAPEIIVKQRSVYGTAVGQMCLAESTKGCYLVLDAKYLMDIKLRSCEKKTIDEKEVPIIFVGNGCFNARYIYEAITTMGVRVEVYKGGNRNDPLLICDTEGNMCIICPANVNDPRCREKWPKDEE